MRWKNSASSCSIVPTVTPRLRCERNLTHSNTLPGSLSSAPLPARRLNSSQVWLCVSQTSVVSVPRTARAFSRAARRHDRMLDGLVSSRTMKSMTLASLTGPYFCVKAGVSSLIDRMPCQLCSASAPEGISIAARLSTSSMRAVFSARSM